MALHLLYCGRLNGKIESEVLGVVHGAMPKPAAYLYVGPVCMIVVQRIKGNAPESPRQWMPANRPRRQPSHSTTPTFDVFGGSRALNIMFPVGKVFFIDFDWAGMLGEAHHPRNFARSARRLRKAEY